MMLFHKMQVDERTRFNTGNAAAIWLGVTQVLLAVAVFYRLYVLGQPDDQVRDFQAILAISIFGYLALQLFVGGAMPIPTWRGAVVVYVALTVAIASVCLLIYGWPDSDEWASTWLPAFLGPALLVGGYALVARLGQWRIEQRIRSLGE
jgi:purine-cytosine permease-like protein